MPTKILVVEDTADIRDVLVLTLAEEGYEVEAAADASEAFDILNEFEPDVILLDLHLPDMSGVEILKSLRQTMTVPILMFTSAGDSDAVREAINAGASDYVLKGTGLDQLTRRIKKHLARSSQVAGSDGSEEKRPGLVYVGQDTAVERLVSDAARRLDVAAAKVVRGEIALEGLKSHVPAVMVIDHKLPDMDGLSLLKTIRADERTSAIGVVMVAEMGSPEIRRSAIRHGAAGYYTKPVGDMEFEQTIRRLFAEKSLAA